MYETSTMTLQLFQLALLQTPIVIAPLMKRLFGNADLPNRINLSYSLADKDLNTNHELHLCDIKPGFSKS